jgi:hypothetical protein
MSKNDKGKPKLSLLYPKALFAMAHVREFGLTKYPDAENWRSTLREQHLNAALRHIFSVLEGEWEDKESGLSHLAHAMTNLMFEIERGNEPKSFDHWLCTICHKNYVDVRAGFDTCEECRRKV